LQLGQCADGIVEKAPPAASIMPCIPRHREAMAEAWGVPDYKYLAMPHPIANLTEEQLDQRARDIVPQIVDILLGKHLPH
jgi:hypothetical protein